MIEYHFKEENLDSKERFKQIQERLRKLFAETYGKEGQFDDEVKNV